MGGGGGGLGTGRLLRQFIIRAVGMGWGYRGGREVLRHSPRRGTNYVFTIFIYVTIFTATKRYTVDE